MTFWHHLKNPESPTSSEVEVESHRLRLSLASSLPADIDWWLSPSLRESGVIGKFGHIHSHSGSSENLTERHWMKSGGIKITRLG